MAKKKTTRQQMRDEVAAHEARYDETTRRFEAWLERRDPVLAKMNAEERYDEVTRRAEAAIEKYRRRIDERRSPENA